MGPLRFQNKTPYAYVEKSRDFQLFCRLLDVVVNGTKFDIDSIPILLNTKKCQSNALPLLQTKLGFLTDYTYTNEALRTILLGFCDLVKNKGSKKAIEGAVNLYLKLNNIETETKVDIIKSEIPSDIQALNIGATTYSIVIGIQNEILDLSILRDILRYIIPFGYNLYFYFYTGSAVEKAYVHNDKLEIQIVSTDVSNIAGSVPVATVQGVPKDWDNTTKWYTDDLEQRRIGAINTLEARKASDTATNVLEDKVTIED